MLLFTVQPTILQAFYIAPPPVASSPVAVIHCPLTSDSHSQSLPLSLPAFSSFPIPCLPSPSLPSLHLDSAALSSLSLASPAHLSLSISFCPFSDHSNFYSHLEFNLLPTHPSSPVHVPSPPPLSLQVRLPLCACELGEHEGAGRQVDVIATVDVFQRPHVDCTGGGGDTHPSKGMAHARSVGVSISLPLLLPFSLPICLCLPFPLSLCLCLPSLSLWMKGSSNL